MTDIGTRMVAAALCAAGITLYVLLLQRSLRSASLQHGARLTRLSRDELAELFVFLDPQQFVRFNFATALVVPALGFLFSRSIALAVTLLLLTLVAPAAAYRWLRQRRRRLLLRQLPDACASMAGALRSGMSLWQAVEQIHRFQPRPISQEFALAMRQQRLGVPLEQALEQLGERAHAHEFRLLMASLAIAREVGGGLAESLERLAAAVRRRVAMEDRIRALTSQGRLQGAIVGALPVLLMGALIAMGTRGMEALFTTVPGWLTLATIASLELCGFALIRRIVRIEV